MVSGPSTPKFCVAITVWRAGRSSAPAGVEDDPARWQRETPLIEQLYVREFAIETSAYAACTALPCPAPPPTASDTRRAQGSTQRPTVSGDTNARLPISITSPKVGMP